MHSTKNIPWLHGTLVHRATTIWLCWTTEEKEGSLDSTFSGSSLLWAPPSQSYGDCCLDPAQESPRSSGLVPSAQAQNLQTSIISSCEDFLREMCLASSSEEWHVTEADSCVHVINTHTNPVQSHQSLSHIKPFSKELSFKVHMIAEISFKIPKRKKNPRKLPYQIVWTFLNIPFSF